MNIPIRAAGHHHGPRLRLAIVALGLLALGACATAPRPPTEALQAAELAIGTAEQARVADYASPELGAAREKLAAARSAVEQKQMTQAARLADESAADARLALARADLAKARVVNDEMRKSTATLKQEMQRNPGVRP